MSENFYTIDFETRSRCDLKKCGAYKYARDLSTSPICLAFKHNAEKTNIYNFMFENSSFAKIELEKFLDHAKRGGEIHCHNAEFEIEIWNNCCVPRLKWPPLQNKQMRCSLARASTLGLPRGLEQLGRALNSKIQKDIEGYKLMLKLCKPDRNGNFIEDPALFKRLAEYCIKDVETEFQLEQYLPELPPAEQKLWELTVEINQRGILCDIETCKNAIEILNENDKECHAQVSKLTGGRLKTGRQVSKLLKELEAEGVELDSLSKDAVRDALKNANLTEDAKALLLVRQEIGKASVRKYTTMINMACSDNRIRGTLRYHGASTGRFSAQGIQPQNYYRSTIKDTDTILDCINLKDFEFFKAIYDSPGEAIASATRNMLMSEKGLEFLDGDYAAIEARVLAWLAEEHQTLDAYSRGVDTYKIMATKIYNTPFNAVTSDQRYLGKKIELGCGYQMGHKTFFKTCKTEGFEISENMAKLAVDAYRELHKDIVSLWYGLEETAVLAIKNPGKVYTYKKIACIRTKDFFLIRLPSGRKLYYVQPFIKEIDTPIGKKEVIHYLGNKMGKPTIVTTYGGKLTENICQATARDVMTNAMLNLSAGGYRLVLTVHDEILAEVSVGSSIDDFVDTMQKLPAWAKGLPIKAEAWRGLRYRK